jgi:hypothetical protein
MHNRLKCRLQYSIQNTYYRNSLQNLVVCNIELACCQHEAEELKPRAVYHMKICFIAHVHFIQDLSCNIEIRLSALIRNLQQFLNLHNNFWFNMVWHRRSMAAHIFYRRLAERDATVTPSLMCVLCL